MAMDETLTTIIAMDPCSRLLGKRLGALMACMRAYPCAGKSTICTSKVMMLAPIALWGLCIALYLERLAWLVVIR